MADAVMPTTPSVLVHGAPGRAALLLVESLIHGLIERSVLSVADAVEIVTTATEVDAELTAEGGPSTAPSSSDLLQALRSSLSFDLPPDDVGGSDPLP